MAQSQFREPSRRVPAEQIKPGHVLHDGLVLDVRPRFDPDTGKPVSWTLQTPHADLLAEPGDVLNVYAVVTGGYLDQTLEQFRDAGVLT